MSRVGARREREGTLPRATAVPRLAKPARHAGYAPGAHRSIGGCRRSGEAASLRRAGQASHRGGGGAGVPRLSRRLSPAATCGARGLPSVPLSRPVPTRDVPRVGLLAAGATSAPPPRRLALERVQRAPDLVVAETPHRRETWRARPGRGRLRAPPPSSRPGSDRARHRRPSAAAPATEHGQNEASDHEDEQRQADHGQRRGFVHTPRARRTTKPVNLSTLTTVAARRACISS